MLSRNDQPSGAMLFVWADVEPVHEVDYNHWYDREHVAERVAIPGMLSATRYRAVDDGARRYLGLYRSRDLDVFRSPPYQRAFQYQTPWSMTNLGRMRNAIRRVGALSSAGEGVGAYIVVARQGQVTNSPDDACIRRLSNGLAEVEGVVGVSLLTPDEELSTPLPAEAVEGRILDKILLVDAQNEAAASVATRAISASGFKGEIVTLTMLWCLCRRGAGSQSDSTGKG